MNAKNKEYKNSAPKRIRTIKTTLTNVASTTSRTRFVTLCRRHVGLNTGSIRKKWKHQFLQEISCQLTIRHIILDRGFYWASVIARLQELHISYIVGYTRTQSVKKIVSFLREPVLASRDSFFVPALQAKIERVSGRCWIVREYSYGKEAITTQLIIHKVRVKHSKSKNGKRLRWEYLPFIAGPTVNPLSVLALYGTPGELKLLFA